MAGISILKDGSSLVEAYGMDLDKLKEGDRVGVMRTSQSDLIFFINGESQGIAANNIPKPVHALINLYGKCVQVSTFPPIEQQVMCKPFYTIPCYSVFNLMFTVSDRLNRSHRRC